MTGLANTSRPRAEAMVRIIIIIGGKVTCAPVANAHGMAASVAIELIDG